MTAGERAVWIAVYAASWHQPTGGEAGHVLDEARARAAVGQAERAMRALRRLAEPADGCVSEHAVEVLA